MTDKAEAPGPGAQQLYAAEQEVRLLRSRLAQREATIIELNRRLRHLEKHHGTQVSDGSQPLEHRLRELQLEIDALHATKTFRYTRGLRQLYHGTVGRGIPR